MKNQPLPTAAVKSQLVYEGKIYEPGDMLTAPLPILKHFGKLVAINKPAPVEEGHGAEALRDVHGATGTNAGNGGRGDEKPAAATQNPKPETPGTNAEPTPEVTAH